MSYADAAKKGPKQSPEEARAPAPPTIEKEGSASSLIDVDSPHVQSVTSDFESAEIKTRTQADRIEAEASSEAQKLRSQAASAASDAKKKAGIKSKNAKDKASEDWAILKANSDNPVVIGNAVIWGIGAVALAFAGYKKYSEGQLDGKVAGTAAAAVGAFAAVDYFASQWLFQNKYPTK